MSERIPQELRSHVLEFEKRLSSASYEIQSLGTLLQMFFLGGLRMGVKGIREKKD